MANIMKMKNGVGIELEIGASLSGLVVRSATKKEMLDTWDKMTEENLQEVEITTGEGLVVGKYENLVLISETSTIEKDGTVKTSFALREKSEEEIRLDNLEEEQEIQNGAIEELATMAAGGEI